MKYDHPEWQRLLPPYQAHQWDDCVRIVRSWLDDDPHDLSSLALLARLYAKQGSSDLARLQYERLLPMTVGQSDVLWALCTQKRLDELGTELESSRETFGAMHQWFRYLVPDGAVRMHSRQGEAAAALIGLPEDIFSGCADRAIMEDLGVTSRRYPATAELLWFVYYGSLRIAGTNKLGERVQRFAGAGEPMVVPTGEFPDGFEVASVIPSEVIAFEYSLVRLLGLGVSDTAGDQAPRPIDASMYIPPRTRPTPDPAFEPMLAFGASRERRKETRVAVALDTRAALLGQVGTSVAPLQGTLVDLSPSGVGVAFPAAQLRNTAGLREDAVLPLKLSLRGSGDAIELSVRVAWIRRDEDPDLGLARLGLEFVRVSPENRARLIHIIDDAARSGLTF